MNDLEIDARSLSAEAQEEKRKLAIRLREDEKLSYPKIGKLLGVHPLTVGHWIRAYKAKGLAGIVAKKQGRPKHSGRSLSQQQEKYIQSLIANKTPEQLSLKFALWTRATVGQLIKDKLGIQLAPSTVGKYLRAWGFTQQKPLKKAYEQNPKAVKQWLDKTYPKVVERAKREDADIHWGDETGLRNDCQHERGYAPKGKTPVIRLNVNRCKINMISSVTNQGKVRFKLFNGSMNADILIDFMRCLIRDSEKKIFLILDNLRVHHSKKVTVWAEKHKDKIVLFYLPAYSPELNPDEYLNCDLKAGVHSGLPARNQQELEKKTRSHMRLLQRRPHRVRKYFQHKSIKYAA